jgi:hypothetical protein
MAFAMSSQMGFTYHLPLPERTPVCIGSTQAGIQKFIEIELQKPQPSFYVRFTTVPLLLMTESPNNPSIFGSKKVRIFYNKICECRLSNSQLILLDVQSDISRRLFSE